MSKLFAVLLGGRAAGCNTELHDVVFVTGNSLKETYPKLVNKWFGDSKRLHIDSSIELKYIDGYEITLTPQKPASAEKSLFFVNFGGYQPNYFGEIHEANFYVVNSKAAAVARAKQDLCVGFHLPHCDDNLSVQALIDTPEIDDVMQLEKVDQFYISLTPTQKPHELNIESDYRKLDIPDIIKKAQMLA